MSEQNHARKANKRKKTTRKASSTKKQSALSALLARNPHAAWWVGGIAVVCLYVWLFYSFLVSPTGFRWRALFGDANYPAGYEIHGIDISHYQGDIDWDKLRGASIEGCPLRFIMIKSTEGSTRVDDKFKENFRQAREYTSGATSRQLARRPTTSLIPYVLKRATCLRFLT